MKNKSLNFTLLAGLVFTSLLSPVAMAACEGTDLATCPAPFDAKLPDTHSMLTWSQSDRVVGFRNDYRNYAGDVFRHGNATPLLAAEKPLKDASYLGEGNTDSTLWTSRSVGKSVVSALVGVAIKEGKIHSLDDLVTQYEPDLKGTAWDGVTLKQLITHTSGVAWNEDYTNPKSDFAQLTECEAKPGTYDCVRKLVSGLHREHPAGENWSYSSGGAWLLGDVLERATGMTLAAYLEKSIWQPYGMASDGVWHAYSKGQHDVGAHGFNATLEDWGRFGEFILHNGTLPDGKQILPDNWVQHSSDWTHAKGSVSDAHPDGLYGYQWWNNEVPANAQHVSPAVQDSLKGSLWALGIFGQMIMVNPTENLVIVQWSTWPQAEPSFSAQPLEASLMFSAIANALR